MHLTQGLQFDSLCASAWSSVCISYIRRSSRRGGACDGKGLEQNGRVRFLGIIHSCVSAICHSDLASAAVEGSAPDRTGHGRTVAVSHDFKINAANGQPANRSEV